MATLRHRFAAILGVAVLLSTVFGGGLAAAQTGYPPPTTVPAICTGATANAGTVNSGSTITFTLCGNFAPGASVTITVNGQAAGTKIADANGSITVIIVITSNTTALVNDPVKVEVNCGANNVVATGATSTGAVGTATGSFTVNCAPTTSSGLAFTGANVFKFLAAALLLLAIGGGLVLAGRRRRSHAA